MLTESLNYELPARLIAQKPADTRTASRLLVLDRPTGVIIDRTFPDIAAYIQPGDCLVLNDTKVLPARFFARRKTGAKLEGLFLEETAPCVWKIMLKHSRKIKTDETIDLTGNDGTPFCEITAVERTENGQWILEIHADGTPEDILAKTGFTPLPPYIKRDDNPDTAAEDLVRYQTVYAKNTGAIAAPTAGMHFTTELMDELKASGINIAYVTLHVGAGTFKPVTAENLADHPMHSERYSLDAANAKIINSSKAAGGKIIAVGTTSVRTLETIAASGELKPMQGATKLFIKPGYEFKAVDTIITNFHLPKSTLIALVGAFAGMEQIMKAYRHAIEQKYRFYSYGDSMMIL
ncbi:MAG: tRNA preQ1(34) S-adenosylmethionine ribosyltransferase-isomerase QueA [Planctomycetes bacterium]|nr:tRNA preQ1(34) S-adenosylmethionine ribosyltransferase-isomerase QueA [Planctomycetota bacterium]